MNPETQPPPDDGEDIAHYDDAVNGRAYPSSAIALVLIVLAGAATFFLL